ncbi:AAA domain-containing protein [Paraburkholderia unamae]|uniref:AAA family ATPase n=1 Tax=Paraburkholderia unamae TaxID=219649 RepID=UPI000DC4AC68|nr:AAA family ATPase [Paraburkholderia unamae]RAR48281.1 AAA domain-containing protein [Paraburkholderia unamae]
MKIRAVKLRITTAQGEFGFKFEFSRGLTVIRGSNSSGKSTFYNTLIYGLGMEELIGGKGEKVLPYAVKEYFVQGDSRVTVGSSEVLVELENASGGCVTLRRAIRDSVRQSKLMEVFEGAHLTEGAELGMPRPTYLFDPGSAQKQEGYFQFLEGFMGYQLPQVPATNGGMAKLYLQTIFAALAVEQKRGWTDYIANIPFFGIRDARIRVTEFLLGLGVFERQAKRAALDADSIAIDSDWRKAYDTLRQAAVANGIVIEGLSATPVSMFDPATVLLVKSDGKTKTTLLDQVSKLRAEHNSLGAKAEAYGKASGAEALQELEGASSELQRLSVLHERATTNLTLQKAALDELRLLLVEASEDLERNKTALKLRNLGAQMEIEVATDHCPTCHQAVDDTLLLGIVTGPQMDLNTNIDYLDSQRKMLQNQINGAVEEIRQSEITVADVAARLAATHDYRNSLRGDVSTGMAESRAIVRRQIQIELELSNLQAFNTQAEALMFAFGEIADRLAANQGDRRALPKETYSDVDVSRISLFEKNFRGNASSFGYESAEIADIHISLDTLTPILSELELREILRPKVQTSLTADSSASDFVRLIWSYLLALYQTSATRGFEGQHPGLLLMDEPGQHSMRSASQRALLQLLIAQPGLQAIVAASFDEDESVFMTATAGLEFQLIQWEGKVIRPLVA